MKRHRSLVPLSHDHHDALLQARRLQSAGRSADPEAVAQAFLRFFARETVRHFREEEELVFPALLDCPPAREPLVQALLEHERLHALTTLLRGALDTRSPIAPIMQEIGELLVAHVRHEERCLFPLLESFLDDPTLAAIALAPRGTVSVADSPRGSSDASRETKPTDPNATLFWGSGGGSQCDAAFLGGRRPDAQGRQRS